MTIKDAVMAKLAFIQDLDEGENGGYLDAALLSSALISGMAAHCWPRRNIDRKRFIELWARHADPAFNLISLPILLQSLKKQARAEEADEVSKLRTEALTPVPNVLLGYDVDVQPMELLNQVTTLTAREIRSYSYPALFYRQVRSRLTHEYATETVFSLSQEKNAVSYVNEGDLRKVFFPIPWIRDLMIEIASRMDGMELPLEEPTSWWIEG